MNAEVDNLELRVSAESQSAASGLDKLCAALDRLKATTKGGSGLSSTARQLSQLNDAMSKLQNGKVQELTNALGSLASVQKPAGLTATVNSLKKIPAVVSELAKVDLFAFRDRIYSLSDVLKTLSSFPKATGFTSIVSSLKSLPKIGADLAKIDLGSFSDKIYEVADALEPLAKQMDRVAAGFSAFPARIQKLINSNTKLAASNKGTATSFGTMVAKVAAYSYALRRVVDFLADCVTSINEYVENVNLFQVSMGDYYDEAFAYAQLVNEKLGVDPSQWMRTQGVFQSIANGFGIAEEQAYALSEGLTELSYDLSSLYNEDIESSALRLQSALAGEIEPIRRLGISITESTLKEFALSKGIDKSVESMTEQEKALLRTLKLIEGAQDIGAVGDFARTLESPANALRVLNQQITQFKRSIGSVMLPAIVQVLPYVQAFVSILTDAISALAVFVGFTMPEWDASSWSSGAASGVSDVADAMDDATSAAEELKSATLGLDELNIISPDSGSATSSGAGSDWAAGIEIPDLWDKDALAQITTQADTIKEQLKISIGKIGAVLSGAAFVVGAILAFSNVNVPLGLKLMAIGVAGFATAAALNWGAMDASVRGVLTSIAGMLASFSLVLGVLLACSGNLPLGIGLIAVGASSLVTALALNTNGVIDLVGFVVNTVAGIVAGSILALGAFLAFSGAAIPLGIALMAVGAATMASVVALNWNATNSEIKNVVSIITTIVAGGMLALGAILAFSGANTVLGVSLLAAGAAVMISTVALNWGAMSDTLRNTITAVTAIVGTGLLALGAILTFSGVNPMLGIPMMALGAASLATAAALNWDVIVSAVTTTLKEVGHIVGLSLIALGAILLLTGVGAPLGLGMIIAGGLSLASAVALNWDSIVESVGTTLSNIGTKFMEFVSEWLSPSKWLELGKLAIDGLFQGLSNIWGNVAAWGEGLLNDVKSALGIHSPSVEFEEIGDYATAGFVRGFSNTGEVVGIFDTTLAEMSTSAGNFSTGLAEIGNGSLETFKNTLSAAVTANTTSTATMADGYATMASASTSAISSVVTALNSIPRNITTTHTIVTQSVDSTVTSGGTGRSVQQYATGGFPDYGQLFIANEDAPELVGTIGRQTAVANTQQIVQGIAAGVAEANMQQNALLREQNELLREILAKEGATYLDGKVLLRSVERASRNTGVNIMSGGVV